MDSLQARELVIEAGKKLVETGLIARTWGNVSCRISPDQFAISPSGRAYQTLEADEIVTVNTRDCSYAGEIEPSSEKGVHAEVYRQRPEINFVIHTHQPCASAVSPLKFDIAVSDPAAKALLGSRVVSIPYGLPGSEKLRKNVAGALSESDGKAFLMVSHGALCLGKDLSEAFRVAAKLEDLCADFIERRYRKISGRTVIDPVEFSDYFVSLHKGSNKELSKLCPGQYYNSKRTGRGFRLYTKPSDTDTLPEDYNNIIEINLKNHPAGTAKPLSSAALIHREIYRKYEKINAIIHTTSFDILTVSRIGKTIYPLLDDFAQIVGVNVRTASIARLDDPTDAARHLVKKLKGRSAVMLKYNGALCCGPSGSDAAAAVMIMEKNCRAYIAATLFDRGKPINSIECRLMRHIYLKRYSRKALAEGIGKQQEEHLDGV